MLRISLDTEAPGLDIRHGVRPFIVTICDAEKLDSPWIWEWDVDPLTRMPIVEPGDLEEIAEWIRRADEIILQNPKFDYMVLKALYEDEGVSFPWDWTKVRDTLRAGHLLASKQAHDLTTMAMIYLRTNIKPLEEKLKIACKEARDIAKREYPDWVIAKEGLECMPSVKPKKGKKDEESTGIWKADMWLPRAIAKEKEYGEEHPWWTVCANYALGDVVTTAPLYIRQKYLIEERGLWDIYLQCLKVNYVVSSMEEVGVTLSIKRLEDKYTEYKAEAEKCNRVCSNLTDGELETLPVNGVSNALRDAVFNRFKLVSNRKTETGNDSMDKHVLDHWKATLPERSKAYLFIKNLGAYRSRKTAMSFMESYRRFWRPLGVFNAKGEQLWARLYPSLNPTGTDTLRWSSSNPNEQNISKKEEFNLRYAFGPAPGREWWSCDAKNIELRIPAYESGEKTIIDLFERPDDPPFYGSNHLLVFSILHPDLWVQYGPGVKKKFADTWYQWTKNGNFAVQYGAMEESGTADLAYHVPGAQRRIAERFTAVDKLNKACIEFAETHGYVETIADKTVDPVHGYPLMCSRTNFGGIKPTVPLNYHVQGTAMWWMQQGMIRVQEYLDQLNESDPRGFHMIMQVHDELVFDFPKGRTREPWQEHRGKIRRIQKLMERGGSDLVITIPTPVSCEYHPETWATGLSV